MDRSALDDASAVSLYRVARRLGYPTFNDCFALFHIARQLARVLVERFVAFVARPAQGPSAHHRARGARMSRRRLADIARAGLTGLTSGVRTRETSVAARSLARGVGFRALDVSQRTNASTKRALSKRGFAADAVGKEAPKTNPDGMPRFPEVSVPGALRAMDYFGTSSFAMTGSLLAAASGMDAFGCTAVGTITAVGGGTVRDILLGQGRRAFWMEEQEYLWIAAGTAMATFFGWEAAKKEFGFKDDDYWIEASDAIGVGAFCVIGAQNGIRAGVPVIAQMLCGVMTATFGGIVRDILVQRPARIFHSYADIYATTAAFGAMSYIIARAVGLPPSLRIIAGVGAGVGLRVAADTYDIRLPVYEHENSKKSAASKGDKRF